MQTSEGVQGLFQGYVNRYNQITINSKEQNCTVDEFPGNLAKALESWKSNGLLSAWFYVHLSQAEWIPHLAKGGFTFHHSKPDVVAMVRWLKEDEPYRIPGYAHTMVGIGGIVMNDQRQVLTVSEKHYRGSPSWKLPGGYVEPGEGLDAAVEREIFEETGIRATFRSLVSIRHLHQSAFGCSDLYLVASLRLKNNLDELKPCPYEIKAVKWMDVNEFVNHPEVHIGNQKVVMKFLEMEDRGVIVPAIKSIHPTFNKPITTYYAEIAEPRGGDTKKD